MGKQAPLLFGFFALLACAQSSTAQSYDDSVVQLRKLYDKCFWDSVVTYAKREGTGNHALQSERAFQACATKERAIVAHMISVEGAPPAAVGAAILKIKLSLKTTAREAATHTGRFAKPKAQ